MQRKWMVLFIALILFSLMMAPVGPVQAQAETQDTAPDCPPYELGRLKDKDFWRSLPLECIEPYKEFAQQTSPAANSRDAQPTATGGPDRFGYTYDDSVAYNWISATTNSGLAGDDEFTGPINIGFNFPFYGVPQSQLFVSTNGLITFGAGSREGGDSNIQIPDELDPNNFIAPFWEDLLVRPYNGGAIYYSQGGDAPNRYFVVEWRNVEDKDWYASTIFSFQAVLHENGDIVFQYQWTPNLGLARMGIEDSLGYDGLKYDFDSWSPLVGKSIRFYYPEPAAYLQVSPALSAGGFAPISGHKDFNIIITNSGRFGTDTYDLAVSSVWPVTLYASNGITPLTDTDSDTVIDTGPILQGASTTVIARFSTPGGAQIGDNNTGRVNIRSSLDSLEARAIDLSMSVPASFVNVFQDEADGAMSFMTVDFNKTRTYKATADNYFAYANTVTKLTNENYFYAWHNFDETESRYWADIEYALTGRNGNIVLPVTKLTDNSSTTLYVEEDQHPSVAVAPNGTVGVVWSRYLHNGPTDQFNYNIYFATLDSSGNLLTGPTNISNNAIWGTPNDLNTPRFYEPSIAASDDNRFIIGWIDSHSTDGYTFVNDTLYAIRSSTGTSILAPTLLLDDSSGMDIFLNSLTGGKVIMTWGDGVRYAVISSNGTISKPVTELRSYSAELGPDAVQLPDGNVAVAWGWVSDDYRVELAILDSSYNLVHGPTITYNSNPSSLTTSPYGLSVTTDGSSHVILTWNVSNKLFYALGDSNGTFITEPMLYKTSGNYIYGSWNGQGNAPYEAEPDPTPPTVTSIVRAHGNHTSAHSVNFTVTFSEPVLSVDTNDFTLNATGGITGESIGSLTGSGSTRTVTVNTGSGNGTLGLSVPVSATIMDLTGNPAAGLPFTSGETYTILKTATFSDVEDTYWAWQYVERLSNAGITGGCGSGNYCPESLVTRAQMAIFLLRGIHGSSYVPPAVGGSTGFGDVQPTHWASAWIKQLAADGITGGCGSGNYCPEAPVTRAQMAVFLLRAKYGSSYSPPQVGASTGFGDVSPTHWAAAWIKQLAAEGITGGCGTNLYCPENAVTRAQMAVFLVRTFNLP